MGHADDELLAALSLGDDDVPAAVREHVAGCATCGRRVADLAEVADLARSLRGDSLVSPPPEVWLRVAAEISGDRKQTVSDDEEPRSGEPARVSRVRRRAPMWLVGAAATVALVAGGAVGWAVGHSPAGGSRDGNGSDVVASTTLASLTGDRDLGSAQVLSTPGQTTLRVSLTTPPEAAGLREVWLLNDDGRRMVAVGLLPTDDRGAFVVPQRLLDEGYRTVDVSAEPDDGDPAHSGVSVARGTLVDG